MRPTVRIEPLSRGQGVAGRGAVRSGGGAVFSPEAGAGPSRAGVSGPTVATPSVDALLALQAADDPMQGRRRSVRRAGAMLDLLEGLKADLVVGTISDSRHNQLMALIGQARERGEAGLEALVDDIELRVLVELAKRGRTLAI
jgi:hypothetical protein